MRYRTVLLVILGCFLVFHAIAFNNIEIVIPASTGPDSLPMTRIEGRMATMFIVEIMFGSLLFAMNFQKLLDDMEIKRLNGKIENLMTEMCEGEYDDKI